LFPAEACTTVGVTFALELAVLTPATAVVLVLSVSTFWLTGLTTAAALEVAAALGIAAALDVAAATDTARGVEDAIWTGAVVASFAGGAGGDVAGASGVVDWAGGGRGVVSTTGQMVV
jgi:hypothetical protein